MYQSPSTSELVEAVKSFIDETAGPALAGHAAFHARVASNVLATVLRELEYGEKAEADERERLLILLQVDEKSDTESLNRKLSQSIHDGNLTLGSDGLLDHLTTTTIDQLSIDQPNYSGLKPHRS